MAFVSSLQAGGTSPDGGPGEKKKAESNLSSVLFSTDHTSSDNLMDFTVTASSETVDQGDSFCVEVSVSNFTDIVGVEFIMNFNPSRLQFDAVQIPSPSNLPGLTGSSFGEPGDQSNPNDQLKLSWFDQNVSGVDLTDGTLLFEVCFTALVDDATASITFSDDEIIDVDLNVLPFVGVTGSVTIGDGGDGMDNTGGSGSTGDFGMTIGSESVQQGQQVCLPVTVSNFTDLIGVEMLFNYDPNVLQFQSVQAFNLVGLSDNAFGPPGEGSNPLGQLKLSWLDQTVEGVSVADGTVIFEICFIALGNDQATQVTMSGDEIVDSNTQIVGFNGTSSTVTIGDPGGGGNNNGGSGNSGDFTLSVGDGTVQQGQEICVPVTVTNFDDMIGIEVVFNYDPSKLQYQRVQNTNLQGLTSAAFGEPGVGANPLGELKISWFDQNVEGVTVADGTAIFEICFTALVSSATDMIFMSDDEIIDGTQQVVPLNSNSGTITIGDGGGNTGGNGDFEINISDASVERNEAFCLDVDVSGFNSVSGLGFTIDYDPARLEFTELRNLNLAELSMESFSVPGQGAVQPGSINLSWFAMQSASVSVPDGTTIFQACFNAGSTEGNTQLDFNNLEVIDEGSNLAPSTGNAGTVTIQGGMAGTDDFTLRLDDMNVNAGDTVCIPVRVDNFTNISGMEFTLNYDETILEYVEVSDFNLQDLSLAAFGEPGTGGNQAGDLKLSWFESSSSTGVTVPDGTAIFVVCFRAIGTGSTDVSIDQNGLEIIDAGSNLVTAVRESGTVNISGIAPSDDLQILFSDATVTMGDEVCVDVSVNNFDNIVGLEFSMEYDPALLEYKEVRNLNLDQLSESSFGPPGEGANPIGSLKLSWLDQNIQGVSVPDGTVIMQVCFTAIANMGTTDFGIDLDAAVEVIDENEDLLPFQTVPGTINITDAPPLELTRPADITGVSCFGDMDGSIDIEISGGTNSYSYSWNYQNATSQDLNGIPAGTYTVTVTDNGSTQTLTQTFDVQGPAGAVSVSNADIQDVECNGGSTGSISITATGGTGALSYDWSGSLPAAANLSGLSAGTYDLTITDVNGCFTTASYTVSEPDTPLSLRSDVTNETCGGQSDGSITMTASGGDGPYSFSWGNGLSGDTNVQNGLAADTYPVSVTDANGCTIDMEVTVEADPSVTIDNANVTFIDLTNDDPGAIDINVFGGIPGYDYLWTGPNEFVAITQDIDNLTDIGEYCVRITDDQGCFVERCFMVLERFAFTDANIAESCSGTATGSIDIEVRGGMPPYSYSWQSGETTQDLMNVAAGTYSVTVTDSLGNNFNGTFPVGALPAINLQENVMNVLGDSTNTNGSVSVTASGGNPGYSYLWDNGATTAALSNIGAGEYCVTVTDENGCTAEACYTVGVTVLPLSFNVDNTTDVLCNGESTGSATIQINGGNPPYIISFADNMTMSSMSGTVVRNNLPGGTLQFVITDADNSTLQGSFTINEASPIELANVQVVHDVDAPGCTGSITIGVTGGNPGYSVQWNTPNNGTSLLGLCEGNYIPVVTDGNGCEVTFDPIFVNTFSIAEQITNAECQNDANGSINLTVSGGSGDYTFQWENEAGEVVSTADSLVGVPAGMYSVTVTETSGNTITETYEVGVNSMLEASVTIDTSYRGFGVSCSDSNDGILTAAASNGAGNYMFVWLQGDQMVDMGTRVENLAAGTYTLEVTDDQGCSVREEVTLTAPPAIQVNGFVTNPSCVGERDGEITVVASGGLGSFSYDWNNQVASPNVSFLREGRYTVTVTDDNMCTAVESFDLEDPAAIQVNIETTPATDGCNGSARASISGGVMPYSFRWNDNAVSSDSVLTGLCPGDYALQVTDARGCTSGPDMVLAEVLDRRFPCMDMRTVITPDGDGLNEEFLINCIGELDNNRIMIFNRWGQLVFETENYQNNWRGETENGEQLPDGAYYFILEYNDNDGNFVQTKGSITLLREE